MTDRELIERAARALFIGRLMTPGRSAVDEAAQAFLKSTDFNPLASDCDAFRLLVDLRLTVKVADHEIEVFDEWGECLVSIGMHTGEDYRAATRHAIVRAAAAIADEVQS